MFTQMKLYIALAGIAALGIFYFMYNSVVSENELLTEQNTNMIARTERDKIKLDSLTQTIESNRLVQEDAAKLVQDNVVKIQTLQTAIIKERTENGKLAKMLAKHDLKVLITKNQSRMERTMRIATNRMFDKLEAASRREGNSLQGQNN